MARYLVTGGCGFIGSHLVDALIDQGHKVTVLDDLSTGHRKNLNPKAGLIVGDVCDAAVVKEAMRHVDGCFHLAAVASVEMSVREWRRTHEINLSATVNVFDAARVNDCRGAVPVVYASSAAVYGDNASVPLGEIETVRPLTAYGADKLGCELHGRVASLVHSVPTAGFRFFNVYGPRQDPSSPYSGVISIFVDRIGKDEALMVFGDGEQCRDFVYVLDVVKCLILGMDGMHDQSSARADVFNVCTGKITSINQLARTIAGVMGRKLDLKNAPPRAGDIRLSLGDPSKAARKLDFRAQTELGQGLNATIQSIAPLQMAAE